MPGQTTTSNESKPEIATPATDVNAPAQKTAAEEEADRLYEERIEEEYAKREGGAWIIRRRGVRMFLISEALGMLYGHGCWELGDGLYDDNEMK